MNLHRIECGRTEDMSPCLHANPRNHLFSLLLIGVDIWQTHDLECLAILLYIHKEYDQHRLGRNTVALLQIRQNDDRVSV